eukprot:2301467-Rhodomonas_salina.1
MLLAHRRSVGNGAPNAREVRGGERRGELDQLVARYNGSRTVHSAVQEHSTISRVAAYAKSVRGAAPSDSTGAAHRSVPGTAQQHTRRLSATRGPYRDVGGLPLVGGRGAEVGGLPGGGGGGEARED